MRMSVSMHFPVPDNRFQKALTGEHWKMVKKKNSNPTTVAMPMAA